MINPHEDQPELSMDEDFTLEDEVSLIAQIDNLKEVNKRLMRKMADIKNSKVEYVAEFKQAVRDGLSTLTFPKVKAPPVDKREGPEEVAIAVLSDWQLAKVTPTYNSEMCEKRIELYGDKLIKITQIQRKDHPVRVLHVWLLGDIVEGELIFPGQSFLIDASLYRQVTIDGPRILVNFLRKMLTVFDEIVVHGVIGNHGAIGGRARRDMDPETNADRMLYTIVRQILESEDRISWVIPDGPGERNWYSIDTIGTTSFLLIHGDQMRGGSGGMPWYGVQKKAGGWATGAVPEHFDEIIMAHYHQPTRITINRITVRCNGSTESYNTYAMEQLAAVGEPSQFLLFCHPETGITAEYCVWLKEAA